MAVADDHRVGQLRSTTPARLRISLEPRDAAAACLLALVYGPVQIFKHQTKIALWPGFAAV
jgi:hypothetical protein